MVRPSHSDTAASIRVHPSTCQVLARAFGASLVKAETELAYYQPSKMTDYAIVVFGEKIGVSVTRAFKWTPDMSSQDMTSDEARRLLRKKLDGIHSSSRNVRNMRWRKQVPAPHARTRSRTPHACTRTRHLRTA